MLRPASKPLHYVHVVEGWREVHRGLQDLGGKSSLECGKTKGGSASAASTEEGNVKRWNPLLDRRTGLVPRPDDAITTLQVYWMLGGRNQQFSVLWTRRCTHFECHAISMVHFNLRGLSWNCSPYHILLRACFRVFYHIKEQVKWLQEYKLINLSGALSSATRGKLLLILWPSHSLSRVFRVKCSQ